MQKNFCRTLSKMFEARHRECVMEVYQTDLACRKCKKWVGVRGNLVQVRADFSKCTEKQYIIHT